MHDDGKRPLATGDPSGHLKIENDDHEHRLLEILDMHPVLKPYIERLEREAFFAGAKSQLTNHTPEFAMRSALLAYGRWVAS